MRHTGALLALISAILFGASTPLAKLLLGEMGPWMLAGLLYAGSGVGLAIWYWMQPVRQRVNVSASDVPYLVGAIVAGGIIGPVLLLVGLARTVASTASLLLTLEGVLTTLLAWVVFREGFDRRIMLGAGMIVAGSVVLAWQESPTRTEILGPLLIAGACLAWAVDNNLTRKVSLADPVQIAMLKGLAAGTVNLVLAFGMGAAMPPLDAVMAGAAVGFLGYGISLVLFVLALRHIGAARTGAYFSAAPLAGAAIAFAFGDPLTLQFTVAAALIGFGVWLHLTERHEHEHEHESVEHIHRHRHDEHHQHAHAASDPPAESHVHRHVHVRLRHKHSHFPDSHHRHEH